MVLFIHAMRLSFCGKILEATSFVTGAPMFVKPRYSQLKMNPGCVDDVPCSFVVGGLRIGCWQDVSPARPLLWTNIICISAVTTKPRSTNSVTENRTILADKCFTGSAVTTERLSYNQNQSRRGIIHRDFLVSLKHCGVISTFPAVTRAA